MLELLVTMSKGQKHNAGTDDPVGPHVPVARRLKRMRPWNFRAAEAHDRVRRRNENNPGRT